MLVWAKADVVKTIAGVSYVTVAGELVNASDFSDVTIRELIVYGIIVDKDPVSPVEQTDVVMEAVPVPVEVAPLKNTGLEEGVVMREVPAVSVQLTDILKKIGKCKKADSVKQLLVSSKDFLGALPDADKDVVKKFAADRIVKVSK